MTEAIASTQTETQVSTVRINNDSELFAFYIANFKEMRDINPDLEPSDVWTAIVLRIENAKSICERRLSEWASNDFFKFSSDKRYKPGLSHSQLGNVQDKAMLSMCIAYLMLNCDDKQKYDMPDGTCFFARLLPFPKISLGKKFIDLEFNGVKYY